MGFFSNLFGDGGDKQPKARKLTHPRDLRTGDIIKFHYLDQADVSGKEFEVAQINTYLYGNLAYPELVLKDRSNHIIYMMVEEEDGEEYLALSKKVGKANITDLVSPDDLSAMQQASTGYKLAIQQKLEGLDDWLSQSYKKVDHNIKGAFIKGDARYLNDEEASRQEKFSSHTLEDASGEYALELEIYASGETELSVTVYHDIDEIEEMWPGQHVQ